MKKPKTKRDFGILVAVLIAAAVFVAAVIPIAISLVNSGRYKTYVDRLTDGINSSHISNTVIVTVDGESHTAPVGQASSVYRMVMSAGMGKQCRDIPEGKAVIITFNDGSSVEFRETAITEKTALRENGLFIRFTGPEGFEYQYDTDKLTFDSILSAVAGN